MPNWKIEKIKVKSKNNTKEELAKDNYCRKDKRIISLVKEK